MDTEKKSFFKGWCRIPQGDAASARTKLMFAFDITTHQSFRDRLRGKVNHTDEQIKAVEAIFAEYGITDIWGLV